MAVIQGGLEERWREVVDALSVLIPVYDRLNRVMSLGRDMGYRKHGVSKALRTGDSVLDAGCGPGAMAKLALETVSAVDVILLDVSRVMLLEARQRLADRHPAMILGLMEYLPFKDLTFNVVMCGFSLRDAIDMNRATKELWRVLKSKGGRLLIIDLGKPDNEFARWAIGVYWKYCIPVLTHFILRQKGKLYSLLHTTYSYLPKNDHLKSLLQIYFDKVDFETRMFGGVVIVTAEKAS